MCLAIPAQISEIKEGNIATVDILGVTRDIAIDLTPQAAVGDYVLVHAGFAIEVVDEQFAQETIDLVKQFPGLAADEVMLPQVEEDAPAGAAEAAAAEAAAPEGAAVAAVAR